MPANFIGDLAANHEDGPYYWERSAYKKADRIKVPMLSMVAHQGFLHSRGQLAFNAHCVTHDFVFCRSNPFRQPQTQVP